MVVLVFFFVFHPLSFFAEREGQRRKLTEKNISLQLVKRARTLQAIEIKKGKEKEKNYKEVLDSVSSCIFWSMLLKLKQTKTKRKETPGQEVMGALLFAFNMSMAFAPTTPSDAFIIQNTPHGATGKPSVVGSMPLRLWCTWKM